MIKMKYIALLILVFSYFPALASMTSWETEKDQEITEILKYIGEVQSIAQKSRAIQSSDIYNEVQKIIPTNLQSTQIWKIGTIAGLFYYPGNASHVRYDEVYDQAEKYCAILLSQRCDNNSKHYLSLMQSQFGQDAGESLQYKEFVKAQNLLCK